MCLYECACVYVCMRARVRVCMYDYHIAVSIKTFARVCVCVRRSAACVYKPIVYNDFVLC